MADLTVMSWNLRTFGKHDLQPIPLQMFVRCVYEAQADIVCIQEVQSGDVSTIEHPIPVEIDRRLDALVNALNAGTNNTWAKGVSGVNHSDTTENMRDAYAFLFKQNPTVGAQPGYAPLDQITLTNPPIIIGRRGYPDNNYRCPGRKPGLAAFTLRKGVDATQIRVVSLHAQTPPNTFRTGTDRTENADSGASVARLGLLDQVGGTYVTPGDASNNQPGRATPNIDTLVLGDFNFDLHQNQRYSPEVYYNLTNTYAVCIGTQARAYRTTYSRYPDRPFYEANSGSSYDNVFVLRRHGNFSPRLTPTANQAQPIDFIARQAAGNGWNVHPSFIANNPAWDGAWGLLYKEQGAVAGLSDHLPVYARFTVGATLSDTDGAAAIDLLPTETINCNGLFHATFGEKEGDDGYYTAGDAAKLRNQLATHIRTYNESQAFESSEVRAAILRVLVAQKGFGILAAATLLNMQRNPAQDVFAVDTFKTTIAKLAANIGDGGALPDDLLYIVAELKNINIDLYTALTGTPVTIRPKQQPSSAPVLVACIDSVYNRAAVVASQGSN